MELERSRGAKERGRQWLRGEASLGGPSPTPHSGEAQPIPLCWPMGLAAKEALFWPGLSG